MIRADILCANLDNTRTVRVTGGNNCPKIKIVSKHDIIAPPRPILEFPDPKHSEHQYLSSEQLAIPPR